MSLPPISPQPGKQRVRRKRERQVFAENSSASILDVTGELLPPDHLAEAEDIGAALEPRASTAWSDAAAPLVAATTDESHRSGTQAVPAEAVQARPGSAAAARIAAAEESEVPEEIATQQHLELAVLRSQDTVLASREALVPIHTRYSRGRIDAEALVLKMTPEGLVDRLKGETGADPALRTDHDPSQIYPPKATALELAMFVSQEEWGDRIPVIQMLKTAAAGLWSSTRKEEELRKLKQQENLRLREEQMERDIQMVAKGEALMRMKQRQEMEENLKAMAEAERRRDEAVERETRAEALRADAEEERDLALVRQHEAEAMQMTLQARLQASRKKGEDLGKRVADLERQLASSQEEARALQEEMEERDRQWERKLAEAEERRIKEVAELNAKLDSEKAAGQELEKKLAERIRAHRTTERARAELEKNLEERNVQLAEMTGARDKLQDALHETQSWLAEEKSNSASLREDLAREMAEKESKIAELKQEQAAREQVEQKLQAEIEAHQADVEQLSGELEVSRGETTSCRKTIASLEQNLARTKQDLEDERATLARALRDHAMHMEATAKKHAAAIAELNADLDQERQEKDMVAQQLVSKIRQLKGERSRAELAESKIPPLVDEVRMLKETKAAHEQRIAELEERLAEQTETNAGLRHDLANEQAEKADYIKQLENQTARLAIEQVLVASLREELTTVEEGFANYKMVGELFLRDLAMTQSKLADQIAETARKEAEWVACVEKMTSDHAEERAKLQRHLAHEQKEKEIIAQQLVSKIRQHHKERERAEVAENRLAAAIAELKALKQQHKELEETLAVTREGFDGYKAIIEHLCRDLANEQAEKADYIKQLENQTARLAIEQVLVASLREELTTVEEGFANYKMVGELFLRDLAMTQSKLADQIAETARKEAEWATEKRNLIATYDEQLQAAADRLAHQKRETETVSQQLVSKIRQFKSERARAETAEASLAERDFQLEAMTAQFEAKRSALAQTEAELSMNKQRLARIMLALDEERRTTSELRVTNRSTEERAERAEKLCRELADTIAGLEQDISGLKNDIANLQAVIAGLKSDIEALKAELQEAARLRAALEAELAKTKAELEAMRNVLEEKDDEGRTLLERLAAMEERHKVDVQRLVILQNQYTKMVATFSEKALLSTPAAASGA